MSLHIRAPAQYLKTRSYAESTSEEALFLLGSWAECTQGSVAFPEIVFPAVLALKKALKKSHGSGKNGVNGKTVVAVKTLIERIDEGTRWVTSQRDNLVFAPSNQDQVERWERNVRVDESPVGKYMRVQRKAREKKQALLDKVRSSILRLLSDQSNSYIYRRDKGTTKYLIAINGSPCQPCLLHSKGRMYCVQIAFGYTKTCSFAWPESLSRSLAQRARKAFAKTDQRSSRISLGTIFMDMSLWKISRLEFGRLYDLLRHTSWNRSLAA